MPGSWCLMWLVMPLQEMQLTWHPCALQSLSWSIEEMRGGVKAAVLPLAYSALICLCCNGTLTGLSSHPTVLAKTEVLIKL